MGPDASAREPAQLQEHRFPCASCGSDLRYAPGTNLLRCAHCGSEEPIAENRGGLQEFDLREAANRIQAPIEETRVARCESCGAEVEFDADLHARECPFCASPLIGETGVSRHIKPQGQLPFLLDETQARTAMNRWLGQLWFAPSDLKKYARAARAMQGIYVPYWTYDAETRTRYRGKRGTVYHENRPVRMTIDGRTKTVMQQTAKVRWRRVQGQVARAFDDVLVLASRSLPKRFTDALAPWDLSALAAYEPRYLAGFRAEAYGISVDTAYGEARDIMNEVIAADVRRDIGGDRQHIDQLETDVGALTFKHVLLPVWMAAYRFRGQSFRFVINARTGAVAGERPYSAIKIGLAVLAAILVALAIAALQILQG